MLKGRAAVITGGSSGVGRALALLMAEAGMNVVLTGRRGVELRKTADLVQAGGGRVTLCPGDITRRPEAEAAIQTCIDQYGTIDILVNNAGRGHFGSVEDTTDEMIEHMFALNVFALWYTTRPALKEMKRKGSGHIINIASMAGKIGYPYNSAYVAAKHACVGFTHALRAELVETGIHASVVCPAGVLTDWASVTEGRPMLPFFSESGPAVKRIARERGTGFPPIEGLIQPERVARRILDCIRNPVAEVYSHEGSEEFVKLMATDREKAERYQLSVILGEREIYERQARERTRPAPEQNGAGLTVRRIPKKGPDEIDRTRLTEPDLQAVDWETYVKGWDLFNNSRFWDAHEAWETVWLRIPDDSRIFFQGIIQLAAAFHLIVEKDRFGGALRNFEKAERKLALFPDRFLGVHVRGLRAAIRRSIDELKQRGKGSLETFDRSLIPRVFPEKDH